MAVVGGKRFRNTATFPRAEAREFSRSSLQCPRARQIKQGHHLRRWFGSGHIGSTSGAKVDPISNPLLRRMRGAPPAGSSVSSACPLPAKSWMRHSGRRAAAQKPAARRARSIGRLFLACKAELVLDLDLPGNGASFWAAALWRPPVRPLGHRRPICRHSLRHRARKPSVD